MVKLRRSELLGLLLVSCFVLTGCPEDSAVWIEPGSTFENLVFRIADVREGSVLPNVDFLRIDRCDQPSDFRTTPLWMISRTGAEPAGTVVYGRVPEGYREENPAIELAPGCYRAVTSGTGRVEFDVTETEEIRERTG